MGRLTRVGLRAMKKRWQADLDRLEADFPVKDWEASDPTLETIRNLATAIAQIDGIITNALIFPSAGLAALKDSNHDIS